MSSEMWHRQHPMRIVVSEFISLDGVVQAPGGPEEDTDGGFRHGGWSMPFFDPEVMGPSINETAQRTDALLYGRRTWQVMAGAWPARAGDPFADWINAVEKHVVSNTLSEADLVDELNLMIEPIALGGGKGIFPADGEARRFELVSATTAATGVQVCRYQRAW